jgi:DEAD/DEAH box helicase domain-containing protein
MGIDIAGLDAVITVGWPGTLASLWQQIGRVSRAGRNGLAVWVAGANPLEAYLLDHPEAVFAAPMEATVFDPGNPYVLAPHLCAAAAELPLTVEDISQFGVAATAVIRQLTDLGVLRERPTGWYYRPREPAASLTDLRGAGQGNVQIVDSATGALVGTVDAARADSTVHVGAVYVHQGNSFLVEQLDLSARLALVSKAQIPYRTMAHTSTSLNILDTYNHVNLGGFTCNFGDVQVCQRVTSFSRFAVPNWTKLDTTPLDSPQQRFQTKACWWTFSAAMLDAAEIGISELAGALHALEHCCIGLLPLLATCDRWDLGGLSTAQHADTNAPTVFIFDGLPGGAGFAEHAFTIQEQLLTATAARLQSCPCFDGCPKCVQSPKCGNANQMLNKSAATRLAGTLTQSC